MDEQKNRRSATKPNHSIPTNEINARDKTEQQPDRTTRPGHVDKHLAILPC